MSQAGFVSVAGGGGATTFVEDTGSATPVAGVLNILGGVGCTTTGSGNTVTIDVSTVGFDWVNVTGASAQMVKEHGYAANSAGLVTLALPLPGGTQFGDTIAVMGVGAGGWKVTQGAGQQIIIGAGQSTLGAAGFIQATTTTDAIELVCGPDNLTWRCVVAPQGNPTVS
jgi:hypothetical protein